MCKSQSTENKWMILCREKLKRSLKSLLKSVLDWAASSQLCTHTNVFLSFIAMNIKTSSFFFRTALSFSSQVKNLDPNSEINKSSPLTWTRCKHITAFRSDTICTTIYVIVWSFMTLWNGSLSAHVFDWSIIKLESGCLVAVWLYILVWKKEGGGDNTVTRRKINAQYI